MCLTPYRHGANLWNQIILLHLYTLCCSSAIDNYTMASKESIARERERELEAKKRKLEELKQKRLIRHNNIAGNSLSQSTSSQSLSTNTDGSNADIGPLTQSASADSFPIKASGDILDMVN